MKRILAILLILSIAWINSCKKDDQPTVAENKRTLEELASQMDEDMSVVVDDDVFNILKAFGDCMSIEDPLGVDLKKKSTVKKMKPADFYNFAMLRSANGGFNFAQHVGTYTWNVGNQGWVIVQNDPNDKIVIIFPSTGPNGSVNDITLTMNAFTEVMINDGWDTWYNPTLIDLDLYKDSEKTVDLYFSATWNTSNGEPNSLSLELFLKPYTFIGSFNKNSNNIDVEAILKLDDERILSVGLDLSFESSDLENLDFMSGYIQYRKVKLEGDANAAALRALDNEPSVNDLNANISLALYNYPSMYKIADIEFFENSQQEIDIQLIFTDGSVVPASTYYDQIIEIIENNLEEIENTMGGPGK